MGRILGWVRPSVHPDGACLLVRADVIFDGGHFFRFGVTLLPHSKLHVATINVGRNVYAALVLRQGEAGRAPTLGPQSRRVVDRQSEVVAEFRARNPLAEVLTEQR